MNLNLFEKREKGDNLVNKFIEDLKKVLKNTIEENQSKKDNELEEYNIYEKKKVFLDNKTRKGDSLAWIMDDNSVCISEDGDGGPISINEIDLPSNAKIGEVYQKIEGNYIYNADITIELNKIREGE